MFCIPNSYLNCISLVTYVVIFSLLPLCSESSSSVMYVNWRKLLRCRFGENAGEATGHVLETAGHCACAAWNIFKIRKALTPTSAVSNGALVTAERMRNVKY